MCLSILCIQHVFLQSVDGFGCTRNKHIPYFAVVLICLNMDICSDAVVRLVMKLYIDSVCVRSTPLPFLIYILLLSFPFYSSSFPSFLLSCLAPSPAPCPYPRPLPMLPCLLHSSPLPPRSFSPSLPCRIIILSLFYLNVSSCPHSSSFTSPHTLSFLSSLRLSLLSFHSSHVPLYSSSFRQLHFLFFLIFYLSFPFSCFRNRPFLFLHIAFFHFHFLHCKTL